MNQRLTNFKSQAFNYLQKQLKESRTSIILSKTECQKKKKQQENNK